MHTHQVNFSKRFIDGPLSGRLYHAHLRFTSRRAADHFARQKGNIIDVAVGCQFRIEDAKVIDLIAPKPEPRPAAGIESANADMVLNSQHHNPYRGSEYCPFCAVTHVPSKHPFENETRRDYTARMARWAERWDAEYRHPSRGTMADAQDAREFYRSEGVKS